jgi:ABC-type bacteriocin/lantibiotic exporter with double-glycine peptidase domain
MIAPALPSEGLSRCVRRLSGGKRQRLPLARVPVKTSAILLLDEATAALVEQLAKALSVDLRYSSAGRV